MNLQNIFIFGDNIMNSYKPLDSFIGNEQIKKIIANNVAVCKRKGIAYPHTLITGASGLGKTALAYVIAEEMKVPIIELNCGSDPSVINSILKLGEHSILLLDEIQSLSITTMESTLYRLFDENRIYIRYPDGNVEPFDLGMSITIIGCTNQPEKLPTPLINRMQNLRLKTYNLDEMKEILKGKIKSVDNEGLISLATATRYIPRNAVEYAKIINNYAYQYDLEYLTKDNILEALSLMGIDEHGLDDFDHEYIKLIYRTFNNNPTGLNVLSSMLGENRHTIEEHENYYIREGLLIRTGRGRMLTGKGLKIAMRMTTEGL
jgi:Holliday junction DNA helicase RuvB